MNKNGNPKIAEYGKKTQFNSCTAVVANEKSNESKKIYRAWKDIANDEFDEDKVKQMMYGLAERAVKGDARAFEVLMKVSGQSPATQIEMQGENNFKLEVEVIRNGKQKNTDNG